VVCGSIPTSLTNFALFGKSALKIPCSQQIASASQLKAEKKEGKIVRYLLL